MATVKARLELFTSDLTSFHGVLKTELTSGPPAETKPAGKNALTDYNFCSELRLSMRTEEVQASIVNIGRTEMKAINTAYRPALVSYFARRIHSTVEAEDLTQEVLMRLAGADLKSIENPEAYLFSIASNLLRDRARRERVRSNIRQEISQSPELGIEMLDPHRVAEGQDMLDSMYAALAELPEKTRRIFVLYRIENVSRKTIADQFGLCESSIDKHVSRAMGYLIDRLGGRS